MVGIRKRRLFSMITEKEKQVRQEFLKLMTENPDLPIVCIGAVDSSMLEDNHTYYCSGCIKKVYLEKIYRGEEGLYFEDEKDDAVIEWAKKMMVKDFGECFGEELGDYIGDYFEEISPEQKEKFYTTIPWETAVVIEIEP